MSKLISMCGVIQIIITWGLTHIWCNAYIRPNSLLIFLSEAIWLFGEGSVCDCNLSTSCMCLFPNSLFKAETSILGIYFIAFVHGLIPFSDLGAFSVY